MKNTRSIIFKELFTTKYVTILTVILLTAFLGNGIAKFLGIPLNWFLILLECGFFIFIALGSFSITIYFDPLLMARHKGIIPSTEEINIRRVFLLICLISYTVCCAFVYLIIYVTSYNLAEFSFFILIFVLFLAYAVPPMRLADRGYGEIILTIFTANLIPATAFFLQSQSFHPLVIQLTFPLVPLFLAAMISTSLKNYLNEMITGTNSMVMMLGWKLAMDLHNWLILSVYLIIALSAVLGLTWNLVWPMFLPLPISIFSIYEIQRIKNGAKPRWSFLALGGYGEVLCMLYVLLFSLWVK